MAECLSKKFQTREPNKEKNDTVSDILYNY